MQPRNVDYPDAPEGARVIIVAENQPEYLPLPVLRLPNGEVLSRWVLSDDERKLIAETGEMYLTVCTFNHPDGLQPVMLTVERPCIRQQEVRGQTVMYFSQHSEPEALAAEATQVDSTAYCRCGHSRGAHTVECQETGCKCLEFVEEAWA